MHAIKITADGAIDKIELTGDTGDAMRAEVGGWFEMMDLRDGIDMVSHDEAKLIGLAYNHVATSLCRVRNAGIAHHDYIAGDVVLVGVNDEGETVDVPAAAWATLAELGAVEA